MATRLNDYKNQISKPSYVDSAFDYFRFGDLLSNEDNEFRLKLRAWLEKEIQPTINDYVERAEFPEEYIPKIRETQVFHYLVDEPFGKGKSILTQGVMAAELSRIDAGIGTFAIVQAGLLTATIDQLGNEDQRQKYVPLLRDLKLTGGWGLTESKFGSDATGLQTTVQKTEGGWLLNGDKTWIGNGNRDIMVVWARNVENNKIQGFIVDLKAKGVRSEVLKHKLALRIVQNCQITFTNVFIPEENMLSKATDFQKGTAKILLHSRLMVCWLAAGICLGVYDNVVKYISNRKQFGVPISSFQLQQEKLARIMSNTQAILLISHRISQMYDNKKITLGQVALAKAFATERAREVARLGREMLGGNGIIFDNYVMKAFADIEALYTYEGTYDINQLVGGRELTGVAAFKVPKKNK
ncbi:hypothetical protein ABPG72_004725 [Tetrahymena utriculariae]